MKFVRAIPLFAAVAILAACGGPADRGATGESVSEVAAENVIIAPIEVASVELQVRDRQPYGAHLTDGDGRTLYVFTGDGRGASNCNDVCIQNWPPLLQKGVLSGGAQVDQSAIGTIVRDGGTRQVTYFDRPLYYYVAGQGPDTAAGQNITSFGGQWHLVSPAGESIRISQPRP